VFDRTKIFARGTETLFGVFISVLSRMVPPLFLYFCNLVQVIIQGVSLKKKYKKFEKKNILFFDVSWKLGTGRMLDQKWWW
jgi:hypothetical protein